MKDYILKIGIDPKLRRYKIEENIELLTTTEIMGIVGLLHTIIHKYEHIIADNSTKAMQKN